MVHVMEKYLKPRKRSNTSSYDQDSDLEEPASKTIALQSEPSQADSSSSTNTSSSYKMRSHKDNLSYDPKWKRQNPWVEYNSSSKGMVCSVCTSFGKVPVQAKGAWVTRLSLLTGKHGGVVEQIISTIEEDKQHNWDFIKKLIRSLYVLVKQHIPHTTTFEGLITLQIENGDIKLGNH